MKMSRQAAAGFPLYKKTDPQTGRDSVNGSGSEGCYSDTDYDGGGS